MKMSPTLVEGWAQHLRKLYLLLIVSSWNAACLTWETKNKETVFTVSTSSGAIYSGVMQWLLSGGQLMWNH